MHSSKNEAFSQVCPCSAIFLADHACRASKSEESRRAAFDGDGVPGSKSDWRRNNLHEAAEAGGGGCRSPLDGASQEQEQEHGGRQRRRGRNETRHPIYRGVRKRKGGRWVTEIREPGKKTRIWLGTFPTPEMAARAYDVASFNLKRSYDFLNFPASVSTLPIPQSCSPKHIQVAAAEAAAAFQSKAGGGDLVRQVLPPATSSSMSMAVECQQVPLSSSSSTPQLTTTTSSFFDEDMIFDMPNVLTEMAHGLMITPPLLYHGSSNGDDDDYNGAQPLPSLWDD